MSIVTIIFAWSTCWPSHSVVYTRRRAESNEPTAEKVSEKGDFDPGDNTSEGQHTAVVHLWMKNDSHDNACAYKLSYLMVFFFFSDDIQRPLTIR